MKKRFLLTALVLVLSVSVSGCSAVFSPEVSSDKSVVSEQQESSSSAESSDEESSESVSSEEVYESEISNQESSEVSVISSSSGSPWDDIPFPQTSHFRVPDPDTSQVEDLDKKYFVNRLSREMLYFFCKLYNAAKNYENDVSFERTLDEDEMDTLMYLLNYECPELIHLSGDYYPHYDADETAKYRGVGFIYCIPKEEYDSSRKQLDDYFSKLQKTLDGKTELEKEKYVYDTLFYNCIYDETMSHSGSAYGSLIENVGRCEALSKGFTWCMRKLDIECLCVSGTPLWNPNSLYSEHSWNIVKINDEWYHVDITTDNVQLDSLKENLPDYGFFNASDRMIADNREIRESFVSLGIPVCSSETFNYHIMNNQFLASDRADEDHFDSILLSHLSEDGIKALSVKFENQADYEYARDRIEEWTRSFLEANSDRDFIFNTYYNKLSRTIVTDVSFTDNAEG